MRKMRLPIHEILRRTLLFLLFVPTNQAAIHDHGGANLGTRLGTYGFPFGKVGAVD